MPLLTNQERIPSVIYQLTLAAVSADALKVARAVLLSIGIAPELISDDLVSGKPSVKFFNEDARLIKKYYQLFKRLNLNGIKVSLNSLKPKQWLTRWKDNWKPARLTKKLDVVPVWYQRRYLPVKGRDYILMDTLLSFGTGLHETTQIMAKFIEERQGQYQRFFDIGTGTGILAMVALKNGALSADAIDIGQLSIQAAKDNMKANGLKFVVKRADIKSFTIKKQYDFVAANLVTHDLMEHANKITAFVRPGGLLAVSGISLENLSRLTKAFKKQPLKLLETVKGKQWAGQLYAKKMS